MGRDITEEFENPKIFKTDDMDMYTSKESEDILTSGINLNVGKKVSYSQINTYEDCPKSMSIHMYYVYLLDRVLLFLW